MVGNEAYYSAYIFDQQFSHQGWSGIVSTIEDQPHTLLDSKNISLRDLIAFELLLEIDALDTKLGKSWEPLCNKVSSEPIDMFAAAPSTELNEVFKIWQDAFEWSYFDDVLAGIASKNKTKHIAPETKVSRHCFVLMNANVLFAATSKVQIVIAKLLERQAFTVEFYFQPENGKFYDKLCPAPVTPKYLIKEFDVKEPRKHELLYDAKMHTFFAVFHFINHRFLGWLTNAPYYFPTKNESGYFKCFYAYG